MKNHKGDGFSFICVPNVLKLNTSHESKNLVSMNTMKFGNVLCFQKVPGDLVRGTNRELNTKRL